MGLIEQQQALAELFTNDSARRELLLRGEGLGVVGENDIEQQDQFNQEIIDFADSLIKKRLGQIKQHIPGTCVILRSRLEEIFQGFAKDEPTTGVRRHLYDSQMFMAYLELNYQELLVSKIDKYIKLIVNKVAYNRNINKQIKPFKDELIDKHFSGKMAQLQIDGSIGEVMIKKVSAPYVDLVKLKANTKDYKKYVTYKPQYRLTAKEYDAVKLKEVA